MLSLMNSMRRNTLRSELAAILCSPSPTVAWACRQKLRNESSSHSFTTKPKGTGTGLGLATVYGIVKQMGGWIWVYSEPGQGTTFKVYFPRTDEAISTVPSLPKTDVRGTEAILVVEDQEEVRRLAVTALQRQGYTVYSAGSATEALKFCDQHQGPLELLVTDVVMPDTSGHELAKQVTAKRPGLRLLYMS